MKQLIAFVAILVGLAAPAAASPITPVVEYTSSSTLSDTRPFTLGYQFTTSTPFSINALGYFADGLGNSHQVGIWNSGGTLLTSATVMSSDPIQGHFQWHSISPFTLAPGTYTIGGQFLGNNDPFPAQAIGVVTAPGFTWITDEQLFGSGLNFPTVTTAGSYGQNGILAVDFSLTPVPEPATLAVFGLLAAGGGLYTRRRVKAAATA